MSSYPTALQDKTLIHLGEDELPDERIRVERTDNQLVELILAGDETAFESLFERHKRLVASCAARYFRQPEQIEEVIQITFAKAYLELRKFRGDHKLSLASWLARITANTSLDLLRSQKRRPEGLIFESDEIANIVDATRDGQSNEDLLINRDLAEKLLLHLPPEERALLQMLNVEEMSTAEAAAIMGWSVSKTKIRAWRARNDLRRIVKRFV